MDCCLNYHGSTIHLSGNYIGPSRHVLRMLSAHFLDFPDQNTNVPFNDEDSEMDSEEEAYDLREVSSDVEMDADELDLSGDDAEYVWSSSIICTDLM